MTRSEAEFHDFVVGFTDPLARLAFLLTDGTPIGTSTATIDALASVRRHWREAETNGAPESLAVEALLTGLPHRSKLPVQPQPLAEPRRAAVGADDASSASDVVGDVAWTAWRGLDPRHRVPLLFDDVSVASRRLVGLDVPPSFGSSRRHNAGIALQDIREVLHADGRTRIAVDAMADRQLTDQLVEVLRAHSLTAPIPTDPYPMVALRVRNLRRRTLSAVAAVVVLLAGATVTATRLSAAKTSHPIAAAGSAGAASATDATAGTDIAVDWPTRGNAASDAALLGGVKALFVRAHPDAIGEVRVLLATDTPAFRIAYVTANSATGVIQSWFSGPVGASQLFEGAFSYGGAVQPDTVLATTVAGTTQGAELVVIAPPTAKDMEIADFDGTPAGLFVPLASANGIAVKDVSTIDTSQLTLSVQLDGGNNIVYHVPRAQLGSNSVERGTSDPGLLAAALVAADNWRRTGTIAPSSVPVALWGGTDALGTDLIVVRLRTGDSIDGLLVEWSDATAIGSARPALPLNRPANRHYGVGKGQPDFPLAFRYGSVQVGVVVPAGIAAAVLVVNGSEAPPVRVDANGFASMIMPGIAEPASDLTLQVNLYDATGGIVRTLPVPLPV